jgi:hypothetical protein
VDRLENDVDFTGLANEVRHRYHMDPQDMQTSIEGYLEGMVKDLSPEEKVAFLENLFAQFQCAPLESLSRTGGDEGLLYKLMTLVLGPRAKDIDPCSEELVEKLAKALNTVLDSLNELIQNIHATFMGSGGETETIRVYIGSQLNEGEKARSLEEHIATIREAFFIAYESFKEASATKLKEIMTELDPDRIAAEISQGFKFGPMRKANLFDAYQEKYNTLKNWSNSGLLIEALLREFERIFQKRYTEKKGAS